MNRISILLSTYNGGKYLKEQLDSILSQSFNDFKVLVRDDGSTDNTVAILKEYEKISCTRAVSLPGAFPGSLFLPQHAPGHYHPCCGQ